jgi:hypothetical protein
MVVGGLVDHSFQKQADLGLDLFERHGGFPHLLQS